MVAEGALPVKKQAERALPVRIFQLDVRTWQKKLWKEIGPSDTAGVRAIDTVLVTPDGNAYVSAFRRVLSDLYLADGLN